ncbi:MAG: hypothetical protein ACKVQC_02475 [Elusimicrobiota bacterium]
MKKFNLACLVLLTSSIVSARGLLTEQPQTLGKFVFEPTLGISARVDEFNSPAVKYKTVLVPFEARLGFTRRIDWGIGFQHAGQHLDAGSTELKGSRPLLLSSLLKWNPRENVGLFLKWYARSSDETNQELPIARGNDYEFLAITQTPTRIPLFLNVGYIFKGSYSTQLGIKSGPSVRIEPGNIFQARASVELPIKYHISVLTEAVFYQTASKQINRQEVADSSGDALDLIFGLTWVYKDWDLRGGFGFGMLDENLTSFDLERGAGDAQFKFAVSYRLKPRRADKWQ